MLNLLQVEDSESDAELILRELRRSGYETRGRRIQDAPAMRTALAETAWDLIICDYRMPEFEAPAALAVLLESGLDIPFIVVSGTIGEDVAVAMMKAGAHDYLMKGNLKRLGATVERELREARLRAERRDAIRNLANREAQLSLAIDATEIGIFDYDPRNGQTFYSDLARRHLRRPESEEPTLPGFLETIFPGDRPAVEAAIRQAFQSGNDGRYAQEYRLKADVPGEEPWISAWGRVLRDSNGEPVRFLGVVRDVTVPKRAERELRFQLQLTACITEQSTDAIVLTDTQNRILFVNPEAERIFGYTFEDFRSRSAHEILHHSHPDGTPFPAEDCVYVKNIGAGLTLRDHDDVFFHKDGTPIPVSVSCVPLTLEGGMIGEVFTVRDIRERVRAAQALRRSDERFRRLFGSDIVGLLIVDKDHIVEANDCFLRMIGYSHEDLADQGLSWRAIVSADQASHCARILRSVGETGVCPAMEKEYIRKDGSRVPVLFAAVSLEPGPDAGVLGFVVDLTERRSLEGQMRQAQKLESIGLLAGGIAHDFNNLLTVILGYADNLRAGLAGSDWLGSVEQISVAADRAATLTRQLLTFSRRNAGEPRTIVLNEVVRGMESMVRRLIGEYIEVILSSDGPWLIHADRGQVEQVILNLAVNARDAMPGGGRLYIETSRLNLNESFAAPALGLQPGEYVSLAVTDTGTGMTPEVQARLFEPFFTTKAPGKGTGLGLATVYGIVRQSGGAIKVHSTPGIGTSIRVLFPVVERVAESDRPGIQPDEGPEPPDASETILLVEDEAGVRHYVRDVLVSRGYRVLDAASGEDALALAEHFRGKIDLLLSDVILPGMKGSELIARLLEARPGTKVLRMSGYPERFGEEWPDGVRHLQKPFTSPVLLARIREVLSAE
jgi:PAS domain S-box-containing protein